MFVSVDAGMMGHAVKRDVVKELQSKYGNLYTMKNVVLSGTHTHGAPGGFLMYLLYDMPSLGFVHETFRAMVRGITQVNTASLVSFSIKLNPNFISEYHKCTQ